jgi:hypothetical protein
VIRSTKTPAQKRERTLRLKQKHATWAQFPTATPAKVELAVDWVQDKANPNYYRMVCNYETQNGAALYQIIVKFMHIRDHGICCLCGEFVPLQDATFEHIETRGMDGALRNDAPEYWRNGVLYKNGVAHAICNG